MKIKSIHIVVLVFVIIFGGIAASDVLGFWETESSKVPIRYADGQFEGEYNPDDIRGSYSFGDVSSLFEIPIEDLAAAFNLPKDTDPYSFQNKELEEIYGELPDGGEIGNGSVKLFVALYKNLPIYLDEETYLPTEAVRLIKENNDLLTEEIILFLDEHTIDVSALASVQSKSSVSEEHETENKVKGTTTFKEVLDMGLTKERIEDIIGGEMPSPAIVIRDYCNNSGISFSPIKTALQDAVDNLQ